MFESSLWDLKQRIESYIVGGLFEFESSLWDLKLGDHSDVPVEHEMFESSLWDLKPPTRKSIETVRASLKVPYGI